MTERMRPLPVVDADSQPFWAAANQQKLVLPWCSACQRFFFYPRALCPHCHATEIDWRPVTGRGAIFTYTIARRAPHPAFAPLVPYVVAMVELDEGPRILSGILTDRPDDVTIGARVAVSFAKVDGAEGSQTMPFFALADEDERAER